jgi:hypothetical protein
MRPFDKTLKITVYCCGMPGLTHIWCSCAQSACPLEELKTCETEGNQNRSVLVENIAVKHYFKELNMWILTKAAEIC